MAAKVPTTGPEKREQSPERRVSEAAAKVNEEVTKEVTEQKREDAPPADNTVSPSEVLSFEDVDDIPQGAELDAITNPFTEKVNELARTGKATRFPYAAENEKWALNKIRRAANNIGKGAKTKVTPVEGDPTKVIIWFKIGEKSARGRKPSR